MSQSVDIIVVGAGFAGLRALYTFRELGFTVKVLERDDEIGGVWNFNRYPGARCDVESFDYSYRFSRELEQEWRWSERYAQQPEILEYIRHVADRFDLRRDIELNTSVMRTEFDETASRWTVDSDDGRSWNAKYLILAMGQLSTPKGTVYPGQDDFDGQVIYSAQWPRDGVDYAGKRIAIIGTGSSGVQMTPVIAKTAKHLTVFQRTANYSIPAANAPMSDEEDAAVKANYAERRDQARNSPSGLGFVPDRRSASEVPMDEREEAFEKAWHRLGFGFALVFKDILLDEKSNAIASDFVRRKIAEKVKDPWTREKLTPCKFPFGTRRISVDGGYFEAFNRDNVELVDISETPIESFSKTGIKTTDGIFDFDIVIYATGFDAFTGSLFKPLIMGKDGLTLKEKWANGPVTQLGLAVNGFPNMFIIQGPGSPSLLANVLLSAEDQIDWLATLLTKARDENIDQVEATHQAELDWVDYVNERAKETLYLQTPSFYNGAEMPGKPRVFMPYSGGVRHYRLMMERCAEKGYEGFDLRREPAQAIID
ncbi:MAG: NAD(P)/FAD-dependent oxidoreductase [Novosphingobium sp.]|nr:NAD(P)/FAD-dependent oxidoreductase [Novosphingobium sp.]